jgi:ribosomal protein L12E/L44/L45/RPP1/RPP2
MEYLYCVLLLNEANQEITEEKMVEVLKAGGVAEPDMTRVKAIVGSVESMNIKDAIENPVAPCPAVGPVEPKKEEKKKEEDEEEEFEEETESDFGMGFDALFGK